MRLFQIDSIIERPILVAFCVTGWGFDFASAFDFEMHPPF